MSFIWTYSEEPRLLGELAAIVSLGCMTMV